MSTIAQIDQSLRTASLRRLEYLVMDDPRSLEIQNAVIDRLLDERLSHATECKYGHPGATKVAVQTQIGDTTEVTVVRCDTCDLIPCFTCKKPLPPTANFCACGGRTSPPPVPTKPNGPEGVNA